MHGRSPSRSFGRSVTLRSGSMSKCTSRMLSFRFQYTPRCSRCCCAAAAAPLAPLPSSSPIVSPRPSLCESRYANKSSLGCLFATSCRHASPTPARPRGHRTRSHASLLVALAVGPCTRASGQWLRRALLAVKSLPRPNLPPHANYSVGKAQKAVVLILNNSMKK